MVVFRWRAVAMAMVVVWTAAALAAAQITFSRDWAGGKRAAPQMALDCGQFARLCRHFVHELKQAMTAEGSLKHRLRTDTDHADETAPVYEDD